ncbi:hypothetical protein ACVB8X_03780 [Streptomyces sp. NRAIS4]
MDRRTADDYPTIWFRHADDADLTSCADLLDDFLSTINTMEKEYRRTMASLYGAS